MVCMASRQLSALGHLPAAVLEKATPRQRLGTLKR
jgi:hypothetical protein